MKIVNITVEPQYGLITITVQIEPPTLLWEPYEVQVMYKLESGEIEDHDCSAEALEPIHDFITDTIKWR